MATELENKPDNNTGIEDENLKRAAKKGVSITISLVMLGFSGWKDLEPGKNDLIDKKIKYQIILFLLNSVKLTNSLNYNIL